MYLLINVNIESVTNHLFMFSTAKSNILRKTHTQRLILISLYAVHFSICGEAFVQCEIMYFKVSDLNWESLK